MKNCPNCGAPIEPYKYECEYCGTSYIDSHMIEVTSETQYICDSRTGRILHKITRNNCDVTFHSISDPESTFHSIADPENKKLMASLDL